MRVSVKYDKGADALYVRLAKKPVALTRYLGDGRVADFTEDGSVVGIEFVGVSDGLDLSDIPAEPQVRRALEGYDFRVLA